MERFARIFGVICAIIGLIAFLLHEPFWGMFTIVDAIYLLYIGKAKPQKKRISSTINAASQKEISFTSDSPVAVDTETNEIVPPIEKNVGEKNNKQHTRKQNQQFKMTNVTIRTNLDKLCNFVAVDCETTGLSAERDAIIEIAAIRFEKWQPVDEFSTLINPKRNIPPKVSSINHITNDMVLGAPTIDDVLPLFEDFIGKYPLVGHNLPFDLGFIQNAGLDLLAQNRRYYDTLQLVDRVLTKPGSKRWDKELGYSVKVEDYDVENFKLGTLCEYFNVDIDNAHRALSDARATGFLFKKIVDAKLEKANE